MIKQFKKLLSNYANAQATKQEQSLVDLYFDRMQKGGIGVSNTSKVQGEDIKKRIDKKLRRSTRISVIAYYRVACIAAVVAIVSYLLFSHTSEVEFIEQYADKGQQLQFYLSDSTYVHLNSNSKLIYPKTFTGTHREVQLIGEAFFQVKHTSANAPFTVVSPHLRTRVLGTKFNVNDSPLETVYVSVYEGKVKVEDKQAKSSVILEKDEKVLWSNSALGLSKKTMQKEDFNQWHKGEVKFNKMSIQEVVTVLNRRFNINLVLDTANLPTTTISGDFTSDNVSDILQSLQFIYAIQFDKKKDGQIVLSIQ